MCVTVNLFGSVLGDQTYFTRFNDVWMFTMGCCFQNWCMQETIRWKQHSWLITTLLFTLNCYNIPSLHGCVTEYQYKFLFKMWHFYGVVNNYPN